MNQLASHPRWLSLLLRSVRALAGLGFVLSVTAHLLALAKLAIPGGPVIWALHPGMFLVWFPALLASARTTRGLRRQERIQAAFAGAPRWMRAGAMVLFAYAAINFMVFVSGAPDLPRTTGGAPLAAVVRGFSGHWMFFYGTAFVLLHAQIVTGRARTSP